MAGSITSGSIAMHLGVVVKPVKKPLVWLSQKCFLAAYDSSNAHYWKCKGARARWRRLGGLIECDAELIRLTSDTGTPRYLLAIRAAPGTPLRRVEIIVKVKNSRTNRKTRIVIKDLGQAPATIELPSLTSEAISSDDNAVEPYEAIYLLLVEAISVKGAHLAIGEKIVGRLTPIYPDSSTDEFVAHWGRYWHVGRINEEKHRLKSYLFLKIVMSAGQLWRPLTGRRVIFQLLANKFALSLAFWSRNLVSARQMSNALLAGEEHHSSMAADPSR